jgi:hypothetical protein
MEFCKEAGVAIFQDEGRSYFQSINSEMPSEMLHAAFSI